LITNTGKNIVAKYLINQAPAYASYIALGCGPKPLDSALDLEDYSTKENLDFEMIRMPITSRGYVYEDGESKIVLTAEIPSEERYEITEVGVFSAVNNPAATGRGSRSILSFSQLEPWEYHSATEATALQPLSNISNDDGDITVDPDQYPAFRISSDDPVFENVIRKLRYERPRFFNSNVAIFGDMSTINDDFSFTGDHVHLLAQSFPFDQNASVDELRIAFSVINKINEEVSPDLVRFIVEFSSADSIAENAQYARFQYSGEVSSTNRYVVTTKTLQQLSQSPNFAWNQVSIVKIYASVLVEDTLNPGEYLTSDDYLICFDGIRLENIADTNPLYGMTGYTVVVTEDSQPFLKNPNTSNLIEFRFGLDVQ
jgi:hypothetical protein